MERYPSQNQNPAEKHLTPEQIAEIREQEQLIEDQFGGGPSKELVGVDVGSVTENLSGRTQNRMGEGTAADTSREIAESNSFTDPESAMTKDLDSKTEKIAAEARQELSDIGLDATVDKDDIRDRLVAESTEEHVYGLDKMANENELVTDRGTAEVADEVIVEEAREQVEAGGREKLLLSSDALKKLGHLSVGSMVNLGRGDLRAIREAITDQDPAPTKVFGYSTDGEKREFKHDPKTGKFLNQVLAGEMSLAMKALDKDGRELLLARVDDLKEKYSTSDLTNAKVEVRDLQRLENIYTRQNLNPSIRKNAEEASWQTAA